MSEEPVCDIVIVNWNSGDYLRDCLLSIAAHHDGVGKVVVVDNGSIDGSDAVVGLTDDFELVRTHRNLGFAKGCNYGAKRCDSPYILFLNPDARLFPNSITTPLRFMQSDAGKAVGICGVRLLDEQGQTQMSCMNFPDVTTYVGRATGLDRIVPGMFTRLFAEFDYQESRPVDQVMGAFFMIRQNLFEELGGFDERFFVYLEEVDLALRARQAGWQSYYLADASAFHAGGRSTGKVKAQRIFYDWRSRLLYGFKHFSAAGKVVLFLTTVIVEPPSRVVWSLVRWSLSDLKNTLRGYGMLLRSLPEVFTTSRRLGRRSAQLAQTIES